MCGIIDLEKDFYFQWLNGRRVPPEQVHHSVPGEEDGFSLVHLQCLVKHSIDHAGVRNLVEQLGSFKSSQPLAGLLRTCRHPHVQVEQDREEVLRVAGKDQLLMHVI